MSGTVAGGRKAAITNQAKYDKEYLKKYGMTFYQYQGKRGGQGSRGEGNGGFKKGSELASIAGKMGGHKSRRGKAQDRGSDMWPEIFNFHEEKVEIIGSATQGIILPKKKHWWSRHE